MTATEPHAFTNVWNQYYCTIVANLMFMDAGFTFGWLSPALPKLSNAETTPLLSGAISTQQGSWIGSVNCLGSFICYIIYGYLISAVGSKRATLLLTIPSLLGWSLIYFGQNYYYVLLGRFLGGGVSGAATATVSLYVTEISNDNIRGQLSCLSMFLRNIGILLAYIIGSTLPYEYVPCICLMVPVVFFILFAPLQNTCLYYLGQGKPHKAENALKYYKGFKGKSEKEENALNYEFERLKSVAMKQKLNEKFQWSEVFNRDALKGLGIGILLISFQQFTANFPIVCYAVMIYQKAGTSIDPYTSSIITAVSLLLGALASAYLADILGRKLLNIISFLGSAIGLLLVALYQYLQLNDYDLSAYQWAPMVCLSFVIFISSAGITTLSILCCLEYTPPNIRTFGMTVSGLFNASTGFIVAKTFPILLNTVDLYGCMLIFGCGSIAGAIFVFFATEETNGQRIDDVDEYIKVEHKKKESIKVTEQHCPLILQQKHEHKEI